MKIYEELNHQSTSVGQEVVCKRTLIKRRKSVGERTDPWGTPLEIGKGADVSPSTTTEIEWSERKLEIR